MTFIINPYAHAQNIAIEYVTASYASTTTAAQTYTRSSVSIGDAPTGGRRRFCVMLAGAVDGTNQTISSSLSHINGGAGTELCNVGSIDTPTALIYREVSSGTTCDFKLDFTATSNVNFMYIGVLVFTTGPDGFTVASTDTDNVSGTTNLGLTLTGIDEGGLVFGIASGQGRAGYNWLTVTDRDQDTDGSDVISAAWDFDHIEDASKSVTISETSAGIGSACVAALNPA